MKGEKTMEILDLISNLISEVGFPISVCIYFIYDKVKTQGNIMKLQEETNVAITELSVLIKELIRKGE